MEYKVRRLEVGESIPAIREQLPYTIMEADFPNLVVAYVATRGIAEMISNALNTYPYAEKIDVVGFIQESMRERAITAEHQKAAESLTETILRTLEDFR